LTDCVVIEDLDDFPVRDIINEHPRKNLECECQVLYDERDLQKDVLRRQFGVDLDSWDRTGGLRPELQNLFQGQCEMEFGILGTDDGLPEFSGWEKNWGYRLGPSICLLTN
jgi:hypothetical protein